jgi:hypothetical protein
MATETFVLATTTSPTPLVITAFPTIPLTTTFTRPNEGCGGIYLPDDPPLFMIDDRPSCLPSRFSTSDSSFFYSPGIACPSGYWTACYDTTGVSSITTVTCCPTYGDIKLSCVADPLSLSSVWETLFCTWIAPETGTVITTTERRGKTSVGTAQVTAPGGINAYGVRMVYESTDLYTSTSSTSSSSSSASDTTSTAATSSTAAAGNSPAISSADSSSGLSTGAKAAIGVVIPLVVIGALILGLLFWRRRKRQQVLPISPEQEYAAAAAPAPASAAPSEEHYQLAEQPKPPVYYYGGPPQPPQPHPRDYLPEMPDSRQAAAELPADPAEPTATYTTYYGYGKA